jgi:hypothetical protein
VKSERQCPGPQDPVLHEFDSIGWIRLRRVRVPRTMCIVDQSEGLDQAISRQPLQMEVKYDNVLSLLRNLPHSSRAGRRSSNM